MRYVAYMAMMLLVLAGSAVWAQCPTPCVAPQPVQVQCPTPCPAPEPVQVQCPTPCPAPVAACPQVCPCPASVPAAMGAGPALDLTGVQCPNFDPTYASRIYEHNTVIMAVTEFGMQRATDRNLRNISGEIHDYTASANNKLANWYGVSGCVALGADCERANAIIAELSALSGNCFDAAYAKTLSELLRQSQSANQMASTQLMLPEARSQAEFLANKDANWIYRLDRWVAENPSYVA